MENNRKNRVIEWGKSGLILLLTLSALWLAAQTPLAAPLRGLLREEGRQAAPGQVQGDVQGSGALPMMMVANLPVETGMSGGAAPPEGVRCGLLYDQGACQALFQRVAGPLMETLSSAGEPEPVGRSQWEQALTGRLGVYMDFQGQVPMSVLVGWLSGGDVKLTATVRRMVLAVWEDGVDLYYRDEKSGGYYRCRSEVADPFSLAEALSGPGHTAVPRGPRSGGLHRRQPHERRPGDPPGPGSGPGLLPQLHQLLLHRRAGGPQRGRQRPPVRPGGGPISV